MHSMQRHRNESSAPIHRGLAGRPYTVGLGSRVEMLRFSRTGQGNPYSSDEAGFLSASGPVL
jgi:hypothetical protein